ncbi:alpha/beta-hydrolase [Pseudovirgaria hyperparasitica]|uniref:Alpha/beta-hydrolase n=1 Tax=Pseudovirgaria hyperparasitica TaxID=470096 RepID=A0A6A6WFY3_9PEZI|nr:alpha/beta-hydrolase [Pseudovirgaria hyperparasitica]KAF2760940.1 alpha/beta-hydrolase [Pseudovirgaria hyperparasitica]
MDGPTAAILKLLVPRIPFIFKTIAAHSLWMSDTSSLWNLRSELTIKILRDILLNGPPTTITKQQKGAMKDPGIKGNMWVSKVTMPAPLEDDARQLLFQIIEELKEGEITYKQPPPQPLEAEWTGYRANAKPNAPELPISEAEKYDRMMEETTSPTTLLYLHGGAHYLMDPCLYRDFASRMGKSTGGRVFNVRYRLAPQNPFPAAVLDALMAYLALLYPPPGSHHKPVRAQDIVFAGDSAGGNLAVVLLIVVTHLHQNSPSTCPTVVFNGQTVDVPLPAGCAVRSPWLDMSRSMPSIMGNLAIDYLPPPDKERSQTEATPPCSVWPADPPRVTLYCEGNALLHPLTSPLAQKSWAHAPPMYFSLGEEMMLDEALVVAQRAARQGAVVDVDFFAKMPHVFSMLLDSLPASDVCLDKYAAFCKNVVERPAEVVSKARSIAPKTLAETEMDVKALAPAELTDEKVRELMLGGQKYQFERFEEETKKKEMMKNKGGAKL